MDNFENKFDRMKRNSPVLEVGEDFENRVFARIKKKKRQRKMTASAALLFVVFAFIFVAQAFLPRKETGPVRPVITKNKITVKEEVPVIEDVVFASSDSRTTYAVEQVVYSEDGGTI